MKKTLLTLPLVLLMITTSCGGKSSNKTSGLEPTKPSTTYTDADDADKDKDKEEPIIVESSPYTQEELHFGSRIFGKDFLEANAETTEAVTESSTRMVDFNFSNGGKANMTNSAMIADYSGSSYTAFSLITETYDTVTAATPSSWAANQSVGGVYVAYDNSDGSGVRVIDGYGNVLETGWGSYFYINRCTFGSAFLPHAEGEPCMPISYLRLQYNYGSSSSSYSVYDKVYLYNGHKYTGIFSNFSDVNFCSANGYHQADDITGIEMEKYPLDNYGKKGWFYTETDGHYRFYNEKYQNASAFAINFTGSIPGYTHTWFSGNHLNAQITYETQDDHNYTFEYSGKYYKTSHFVFEYTTGKTYLLKDVNYIVTNTADMKYSNTFYDITLANIKFISNKALLDHTYSFLIDKDYILRDDVTDLISSKIVKTKTKYYSEAGNRLSFFDPNGRHTLSIDKANVTDIYPNDELIQYKTAAGKYTLVDFRGIVQFNADFDELLSASSTDGYRYTLGKVTSSGRLYLLDKQTNQRIKFFKYGKVVTDLGGRYVYIEDTGTSRHVILDLYTGEAVYTLETSEYVNTSSTFENHLSGIDYSYVALRFNSAKSSSEFKVVKFGQKVDY